ncbi:unnamed protein product (macronuclear) [Paramecium tetraurelia]|uniref:RING-type domain-containing protein n=1 Tax=Paramecium tetraurelia TaxID=5888 RepID=A0CWM4_PARTE|nr:uncharacterized protein GSPATT00001394001 [Paramecium tetraurelia]CAK75191.1 unnamed protein product [Paramecium tetraurelia]|eukprot:XP_001442588.1 hypothetical protein (macronuclear) [Paramecium tetraurelia strain d4-2]
MQDGVDFIGLDGLLDFRMVTIDQMEQGIQLEILEITHNYIDNKLLIKGMILILFYFFITTLGQQTININQDYLQNGELFELESSQLYDVIQEIENGTMFFQVTSVDTQKYIQVELYITAPGDGEVNLVFAISKNNLTTIQNKTISAAYIDANGYSLKKNYHNIIIPANSFRSGDKFYITNLKMENETTYQYFIGIKKSDTIPCPKNCNYPLNGFCNSGTCDCNQDSIDLDCSKKAIKIPEDIKLENVTISGTGYLYFEQTIQLEGIILEVGIQNTLISDYSSIIVYLMYENFKFGVPTPNINNYKTSFSSDQKSKYANVPLSELNKNPDLNRFERLLITIVAPDTCQFYFNISIPPDDSSLNTNLMLIYFLVSLAVVLVLTWIIVTLIRYRQRNRVQNEIQLNQQQLSQQQRRGQKNGINSQQLDHYMRKILWKNLSHHPKIKERRIDPKQFEACTVCLIEYDEGAICRVTPCVHVFHADCLHQWMVEKKHETCPMCREDLNEQALEKFAEQEKPNNPENQVLKKGEYKQQNQNGLMVIQERNE